MVVGEVDVVENGSSCALDSKAMAMVYLLFCGVDLM